MHTMRYGGPDDCLVVQTYNGMVVIHGGDPKREGEPTTAKDTQDAPARNSQASRCMMPMAG